MPPTWLRSASCSWGRAEGGCSGVGGAACHYMRPRTHTHAELFELFACSLCVCVCVDIFMLEAIMDRNISYNIFCQLTNPADGTGCYLISLCCGLHVAQDFVATVGLPLSQAPCWRCWHCTSSFRGASGSKGSREGSCEGRSCTSRSCTCAPWTPEAR